MSQKESDQKNTEDREETGVARIPFDAMRRPGTWYRIRRSILMAKTPVFGFIILFTIIGMAIFADFVAPHDPNAINIKNRIKPPCLFISAEECKEIKGLPQHPLGTDGLGRDVLSRLIFGARVSLIVGFSAVFVAGLIGITLGLMAGFFGGRIDDILMRLADIQLAFPNILLAISVLAVLTATQSFHEGRTVFQRLVPLILTLGVPAWVTYARMVRGETLSLRESEFVDAARALGDSRLSIMFRHILPNALAPLIVLGSFNIASTILAEASLSFLGLGVSATVPTWGGMLAESREMLVAGKYWLATIPGLAIVLTVLSINIIGDWMRDFFDPRLRN